MKLIIAHFIKFGAGLVTLSLLKDQNPSKPIELGPSTAWAVTKPPTVNPFPDNYRHLKTGTRRRSKPHYTQSTFIIKSMAYSFGKVSVISDVTGCGFNQMCYIEGMLNSYSAGWEQSGLENRSMLRNINDIIPESLQKEIVDLLPAKVKPLVKLRPQSTSSLDFGSHFKGPGKKFMWYCPVYWKVSGDLQIYSNRDIKHPRQFIKTGSIFIPLFEDRIPLGIWGTADSALIQR